MIEIIALIAVFSTIVITIFAMKIYNENSRLLDEASRINELKNAIEKRRGKF